jgi:hypothetical protein
MSEIEVDENGVVVLASSEGWRSAYDKADKLEKLFPGQVSDLFYAIEYNDRGPLVEGAKITDLKLEQEGCNDGDSWIWHLTVNGERWSLEGWCDYTGWDCQSGTSWEKL